MNIVGVTGQIGHGKSTLSKLLGECAFSSCHFESHQVVMEVANAWQQATTTVPQPTAQGLNDWITLLPPIIEDILHAEADETLLAFNFGDEATDPSMFEKLYQYVELLNAQPQLLRQEITAADKELFRPLLQWLGGYLVKMVGPGVWYDEIIRRVKLQEATGCTLAIVTGLRFPGDAERILEARGMVVRVIRTDGEERDETDPTERERMTIPYQVTVYNDGSLADLARLAARLCQDIERGQVQTTYHAAPAPEDQLNTAVV